MLQWTYGSMYPFKSVFTVAAPIYISPNNAEVPRAGVPAVGHTAPCSSERSYCLVKSSQLWVLLWEWGLGDTYLCFSYLFQCGPFILNCGGAVQLVFRSFLEDIFICSGIFSISVGNEFRIFLCHHLGPASSPSILYRQEVCDPLTMYHQVHHICYFY